MGLPFKKRVMIVEDDQEIRNSFTLIVNSSQKFMVVNAYGTAEDAIANLNRDKPVRPRASPRMLGRSAPEPSGSARG